LLATRQRPQCVARLPTLQGWEGHETGTAWGFAANDLERYFRPLASCFEARSCLPEQLAEQCAKAGHALDGQARIDRLFEDGGPFSRRPVEAT
jgi:hypothetical protein